MNDVLYLLMIQTATFTSLLDYDPENESEAHKAMAAMVGAYSLDSSNNLISRVLREC